LVKLTTLFNACIRQKHVPDAWKNTWNYHDPKTW
jgi:hypothetical protein